MRFGKDGKKPRPASQETCQRSHITSSGGVPRWSIAVPLAPLPYSVLAWLAYFYQAFAPLNWGKPMSNKTSTSSSGVRISTLGTPRIGPRRELKFALEDYWAGKSDLETLSEKTAALRCANWARQNQLGVDHIPSNDFSLYDHVLDTCVMVGAIPDKYQWEGGLVHADTYFAMARGGTVEESCCGKTSRHGVSALEMTKWFDTNYHYMVPELTKDQTFTLASTKVIDEFREAKALGFKTRPVLLGPVTLLKLSKADDGSFNPLSLLDRLLPVYSEILRHLRDSGADWVQIDEPALVLDLNEQDHAALQKTYQTFSQDVPGLKLMLTSYFGALGNNLDNALSLPVAGLHIDLVRAPEQLDDVIEGARAFTDGISTVAKDFRDASDALAGRRKSAKVHDNLVTTRALAVTRDMAKRHSPFATRRELQQSVLKLPPFPTTTIGSFPQTTDVRKARAAFANGRLDEAKYDAFLQSETKAAIRWQEELGIDVLVHGEFERNDMVQYFGEKLAGYAFTKHGWVQSYGSRYVRPPIIFGDVSRPAPMTVKWTQYAQSLTDRPVKGMLTGPVTMMQWSFVRDDLPRRDVCAQIALALRDEVCDLEAAGIRLIQIDEPAIREGLPIRRSEWKTYLDWAVECFRLSASGVRDETQIHTHMCYSEFNDIIEAIGAMDADVISIETSRSRMELLDAFVNYAYPNDIGPGVYDIHSPRVPTIDEMVDLLVAATKQLASSQIWVNPDCGLKTRNWEEVRPALANMVEAARKLRTSIAQAAQ